MLRGLTERPNVQSTLILSRRDGSIIRATENGAPRERGSSISTASYQWSQAHDSAAAERERSASTGATDTSTEVKHSATPAELLAASIFQFVNHATGLCEILGTTSRGATLANDTFAAGVSGGATKTSRNEKNSDEDAEAGAGDDEVQLLRLRMKHQEIIMFPDSNYICCVVQRVGRAATANGKR